MNGCQGAGIGEEVDYTGAFFFSLDDGNVLYFDCGCVPCLYVFVRIKKLSFTLCKLYSINLT